MEAERRSIPGAGIAAMLIAAAQAPLGSTHIAVALPSIGFGLHADLILITGLLVTSYLVVNVVCQGPGGALSDLVGHARMLWIGIGLYTAGALIGAVAPGIALLVVSRCVMAIAGALVVPATLALLRLNVPAGARGRVFGLYGATMGCAAAVGPALGGELVSLFGWRAIFFANLPFLALASMLLRAYPVPVAASGARRRAGDLGRAFDFPGVALMALALTLAIAASGMDRPYAILMLALAVATGFAFVIWETRATAPVFDPGLFRIRAFAAGTSIIALQNFAMYGLLFELPQFFQRFRETPPREVGYLLFAMMIGMVFAAPVGGRLTDRLGARKSCLVGTACLLAGALLMRRLKSFVVPPDAFLPLLLFGIGMGLCSAPAQSSLMSAVGPERVGMAAGVSSTLRYLGGIGGILVLGVVLGSDADVTAERHVAMAWVYVAAIAISSLACFRLPGRVSGNAKPPPRPSRPRRGSPR